MKKILALLLAFTFIFILSACGGSNSGSMTSSNSKNNNYVAEAEDVDSNNKATESAEPEYELSEFSTRKSGSLEGPNDTILYKYTGYYWVTNTGSVPFRIVSFSVDILNKEGLLVDSVSGSGDFHANFKCTIPVYPGEKAPIILELNTIDDGQWHQFSDRKQVYTADDIGKVNPSLRVEATDYDVSEIPCTDDIEEDDYLFINNWIVTNDTEEDITAIVYYEIYYKGELSSVNETSEKAIKAGYKERIECPHQLPKEQKANYSVVSTAYRIISKGGQSSN